VTTTTDTVAPGAVGRTLLLNFRLFFIVSNRRPLSCEPAPAAI